MNLGSLSSASFDLSMESAMQAVAKFLQDSTRAIEWLLSTYGSPPETSATPESSDVRTSLSIGIPNVTRSALPNAPADSRGHVRMDSPLVFFQTLQPHANALNRPELPGLMLAPAQHWFPLRGGGSTADGRLFDANSTGNQLPLGLAWPSESVNQHGSGVDREALKAFLKEMQKTVQEWSGHYNLLTQGKATFTREGTVSKAAGSVPRFPDTNQPDPHSTQSSGIAVGPPLDLTEPAEHATAGPATAVDISRKMEASWMQNGPRDLTGKTAENSNSPHHADSEQKNSVDAPLDKVVEEIASQLLQYDVEPPSAEMPDVPPTGVESASTQVERCAEAHAVVTNEENAGTSAGDFVTPDKHEAQLQMTVVPTPPSKRKKLAVRSESLRRTTQIVSSPDWLPPGWTTEVKIRNTGNSAGSKDKYYVDPITGRKFRSRKEVFRYLETGTPDALRKTAAELKKTDELNIIPKGPEETPDELNTIPDDTIPDGLDAAADKVEELKKSLDALKRLSEEPIVKQVQEMELSTASEPVAKKRRGRPRGSTNRSKTAPSTSGASSSIAAAPSGVLGNVFTPYRTGQPSEWLVYESVASLPFPVFDPFYYSDLNKSNGNKGPSTIPWFFTGPEASWRPFMDASGFAKPPAGATPNTGPAAKKSTPRGKKSSKKSSSGIALASGQEDLANNG